MGIHFNTVNHSHFTGANGADASFKSTIAEAAQLASTAISSISPSQAESTLPFHTMLARAQQQKPTGMAL